MGKNWNLSEIRAVGTECVLQFRTNVFHPRLFLVDQGTSLILEGFS